MASPENVLSSLEKISRPLGDPPPGDEKDCTFLTLDASTPYLMVYEPADAGKLAHYMLRWRMSDGSVSAWGETISATITA